MTSAPKKPLWSIWKQEKQVNTRRPVSMGAGNSQKALRARLVQSQEASWRKKLMAVSLLIHTLSMVWGLLH